MATQQGSDANTARALAAAAAVVVATRLSQAYKPAEHAASLALWLPGARSVVSYAAKQVANLAQRDYMTIREEAGIPGTTRWAPVLPPAEAIERSLMATATIGLQDIERYNRPTRLALARASKLVQGAAVRHATDAWRSSTVNTAAHDPRVVGWTLITRGDGDVCSWCAMQASRGAVFEADSFAKDPTFRVNGKPQPVVPGSRPAKTHDFCRCISVPLYSRDAPQVDEAKALYAEWLEAVKRPAELGGGTYSGKDALNAWRRYWTAKNK